MGRGFAGCRRSSAEVPGGLTKAAWLPMRRLCCLLTLLGADAASTAVAAAGGTWCQGGPVAGHPKCRPDVTGVAFSGDELHFARS